MYSLAISIIEDAINDYTEKMINSKSKEEIEYLSTYVSTLNYILEKELNEYLKLPEFISGKTSKSPLDILKETYEMFEDSYNYNKVEEYKIAVEATRSILLQFI